MTSISVHRHEAEHRERLREEHASHHPPPLTSLHGSHGSTHAASHDPHPKHNAYNNHRTMEYDRLPPSRTLQNDKHSDRVSSELRRVQSSHNSAGSGSAKVASQIPLSSNVEDKEAARHALGASKSAAQLGPYDLSGHSQSEFNRHFQEFYRSQHHRDAMPGHVTSQLTRSASEPVISKLDLEEKRKKEERRNGVYASSESESDSGEDMEDKRDRYRRRMLRIVRRSRLKADVTQEKTVFFTTIGLITHKHRKGKCRVVIALF